MAPIFSEETLELMRFVAKKSRNVKGPINVYKMCREFKDETEASGTTHNLRCRIDRNRRRIPEMDEFDMDTKARMMMAVSASVDDEFLRELRNHAHVEVDDQRRIIRYEKRGSMIDDENRSSDGPSSSAKRKREDTSEERKQLWSAREFLEDDNDLDSLQTNQDEENHEETIVEQKPRLFLLTNRSSRTPKEPSSTSVRDLLLLLRSALLPVQSPLLNGLRRKIEAKIQKLSDRGRDRQIPLENLNLPFDLCLFLLMKHASPKTEDESTGLRYFLCNLNSATCHLIHPSMMSFHEKMKSCLEELNAQNKSQKISIKIIHNAIDPIINFIDP